MPVPKGCPPPFPPKKTTHTHTYTFTLNRKTGICTCTYSDREQENWNVYSRGHVVEAGNVGKMSPSGTVGTSVISMVVIKSSLMSGPSNAYANKEPCALSCI